MFCTEKWRISPMPLVIAKSALPVLSQVEAKFLRFVKERWQIYWNKRKGLPKPWTVDPVLQTTFFCNMKRENDRVTKWIATEWREPNADDPDLWFAMTVARVVNWPDSLREIGYPIPWDAKEFVCILEDREARGEKSFHQAYKPPTPPRKGMSRIPFVAHYVLNPIWTKREQIRVDMKGSLRNAHRALMKLDYLGSFLAAQIVADLKYAPGLINAPDWETFAASGPGSKRGLNRLTGRPVEASWSEHSWYHALTALHQKLTPHYRVAGLPVPHLQDFQNQLCEGDKYFRALEGKASLRRYDGLPTMNRPAAIGKEVAYAG
jgi:hypothetical protein